MDSNLALQANLEDLRREAAALRRLVEQLASQLADRDAQIRMVLEERFYRPVQASPAEQTPAPLNPEDFSDVTQFDGGSDADWLKREEATLARMRAKDGQG